MAQVTIRVKLNRKGVGRLAKGSEALAMVERIAKQIAETAGEGFEYDARLGTNRARASVVTATREAMLKEAKNRILTKSVASGARVL